VRTVGVLGGMGPLATVDFMGKVIKRTPARCDQEHVPMLVHSVPQIPDRTAAILRGGEDPLPHLVRGAQKLESIGADFIAIPCNTAHNWHKGIQDSVKIPVLHIVDAAVDDIHERGIENGRIGILATEGTIAANVYSDRLKTHGYTPVIPNAAEQKVVSDGIAAVKAGDLEKGRTHLKGIAKHLLDDGAKAIILGCTEIPVALEKEPTILEHSIDATDALARKTVAYSREGMTAQSPSKDQVIA